MAKEKINCWEFKKCGREPGGRNTIRHGVCPASLEVTVDGVHGGRNAGRCCWVVASGYRSYGPFGCLTDEFNECHKCDFYHMVKKETDLIVYI